MDNLLIRVIVWNRCTFNEQNLKSSERLYVLVAQLNSFLTAFHNLGTQESSPVLVHNIADYICYPPR